MAGLADIVGGSGGGSERQCPEPGEDLFDRIQAGRVFGQEEQPCAGLADRRTDGLALVGAGIVEDDDTARPGRGRQALPGTGQEALAIDRPAEHAGGLDAVMTECRRRSRKSCE